MKFRLLCKILDNLCGKGGESEHGNNQFNNSAGGQDVPNAEHDTRKY